MQANFRNRLRMLCVAAMTLSVGLSAQAQVPLETVQIVKGVAKFDVSTNILGLKVRGTSDALEANVRVRRASDQLVLEEIEAWLPIKSLKTGIGIRDAHMHDYVFTADDGQTPDLRFTGANLRCPTPRGHEVECNISGNLTIRGVQRPFTLAINIREQGGLVTTFRAVGEGSVKLSDYGIERPSYLGVTIKDAIKLRIEFTAKKVVVVAANSGRSR